MISPSRLLSLPALLAGTLAAAAQQTPPSVAPADPTKQTPPAEIVPSKPETRPPGGKTVAPPTAAPLSPGSKAPTAEPAPQPLKAIIGALPEAELDKVLELLRERYVAQESLSPLELKRATVQGLLERLQGGATLLPPPKGPVPPSPFRVENIDTRAGYVRFGTLTKESLPQLDQALEAFVARAYTACILDFRSTPAGIDFELAAEISRRFCPKGQLLFTVHQRQGQNEQIFTSKSDPRFRGLPIILVDADTAGGAELIAGVLRLVGKGIVIGQKTKGQAAEFAETPLEGGHVLRYAVAEARLPGGVSLLAGGVAPDIAVQVSAETVDAVLKQALETGVAPLLVEPDRPRLNEAALVAGTNPEIDALQAAQRLKGEKSKPVLRDDMLLRALDLITSLSVLKR